MFDSVFCFVFDSVFGLALFLFDYVFVLITFLFDSVFLFDPVFV